MTNKQAIEWLKLAVRVRVLTKKEFEKFIIAANMAMNSIDMWDKVIKELDEKIDEQYVDKYDFCYQQGIEFALELIKKYKKEIEE